MLNLFSLSEAEGLLVDESQADVARACKYACPGLGGCWLMGLCE